MVFKSCHLLNLKESIPNDVIEKYCYATKLNYLLQSICHKILVILGILGLSATKQRLNKTDSIYGGFKVDIYII